MSSSRKILFRIAAIGLGLSAFVVFEIVCRLAGWGMQSSIADSFSEFASVRPLFVPDKDDQQFVVAENRKGFFADESFVLTKPANGRRIFVFGGSTVQGRPFSIPTSFTTFLEIGLQSLAPEYEWEVVNCGGISYASYRLVPLLQECTGYQPDLFIVCTGHNEFLECVTYANVRSSSPATIQSHRVLSHLQSFQLVKNAVTAVPEQSQGRHFVLPTEVDAILDHRGGLELYSRVDLYREQVNSGFRSNLQNMISIADQSSVPLVFMAPPSNLADCPPFKSEFGSDITKEQQHKILEKLELAREYRDTHYDLTSLRAAAEMDPQFAFTWYQLGRTLLAERAPASAAEALIRARDEDVCPLRMTTSLITTMREVATENGIPLLDLHELMSQQTSDGIPGDSILVDHIHPSFHGQELIAFRVLEHLAESGFCPQVQPGQRDTLRQEFEDHLISLDDLYFLRGQRALESLRAWTQGRADGPKLTLEPGR